MSKLQLFFAIILILFGFSKCSRENPVPEVYINVVIQLNDPSYIALNSVGNSVYVPNQGFKGIIITRTEIDKFTVYDASCTYKPNNGKSIIKIKGMNGVCPECGSNFSLLTSGYVVKDNKGKEGPATMPLKIYSAKFNKSANTLYVYN